MKHFILLLSVIFVSDSFSMASYLKGALITVKLKSGKTYNFSAEEYAVVKRSSMGKLEAYKALAAYKAKKLKRVKRDIKKRNLVPNKRNRVYVLGGYGNTGDLKSDEKSQNTEIRHRKGFVGGVGYQRKVSEKLNVGVQVQTNGTGSIGVGTDF